MTTAEGRDSTALHVRCRGQGDVTYLLLHGLGATGEVWQGCTPLLVHHDAGQWLGPDLRGHRASPAACARPKRPPVAASEYWHCGPAWPAAHSLQTAVPEDVRVAVPAQCGMAAHCLHVADWPW